MKTFTLSLFFFFSLSLQLSATVFTVNNTPGSNAQFAQLQPAHDAASPGDTLQVSGSLVQYSFVNLYKKLTIIGPGFKPSNVDQRTALIQAIRFYSSEASGSNIIGITTGSLRSYVDFVNNLFISKSLIYEVMGNNSTNWTFINNILLGGCSGINSSVYRNNISRGSIYGNSSSFNNNVFLPYGSASINGQNLIISNNIFFESVPNTTLNSIYNNNIYYNPNYFVIYTNQDPNKPDSNSLSGNFINVNPQFVNVISGANFDFSFDYSLSETSVGKNAGTDGSDIGVFGGAGFSITGEPSLPIVTTLIIKNAAVEQNGELQVEIKGRANN